MTQFARIIFSLTAAFLLTGCGAHKGLNMYAHSTVGLNVDRSPPNARIGLTRDEAVVTPMFAGGQKPNVAAGFNASYDPVKRLLFGVSTFFAGGQAATDLTDSANRPRGKLSEQGQTPQKGDAGDEQSRKQVKTTSPSLDQQFKDGTIICLNERPKAPNFEPAWLARLIPFYDDDYPVENLDTEKKDCNKEPYKSKHFVFTSDTTFGVKATWLGTDVLPNKLDAGFNRKEYAHVPYILKEREQRTRKGKQGINGDGCPDEAKYLLKIPSYFAYVNEADVKDFAPKDERSLIERGLELARLNFLRFGYNQVFATGKAAENLAKDPDMQQNFREIFLEGKKNDEKSPSTAGGTPPAGAGKGQ